MQLKPSRRRFLQGAAASVLLVGLRPDGVLAAGDAAAANLTPFVKVGSDGSVTAIIKHFEKGQGPATGLTTLIAEELGLRMDQIGYEFAPSDPSRYANLLFGTIQGTGGSTAMANSYMQYRTAGAAARAMLIAAAAEEWGVEAAALTMSEGMIEGDGRSGPMGDFVGRAAELIPPEAPVLTDPGQFRLISNPSVKRVDTAPKIDGTAQFAMDVQLEDQIIVVIARAPRMGGTVTSVDDSAAREVKGFLRAAPLPTGAGVAVYAEHTWAAFKAREALEVTWDFSAAEARSSDQIREELIAGVQGAPEHTVLGTLPDLSGAAQVVDETFYFPLLAHAPMEPLTCTIEPTEDGGIVLHDGAQMPTGPHMALSQILELPMEKVAVNTMFAGGSFGRRATPTADYQVEAGLAFAMTDRSRPVKLVWSREDDITGGMYRPAFAHRVRVGLDDAGNILGWDHRVCGQSIMKGTPFEAFAVQNGIDHSSVEGISDSPYAIPGMHVGLTDHPKATSVLWWRSVGHTHTAYVMESMMDIAASAAGRDPLEFRLAYLAGDTADQRRKAGVLRLAAEKAGWGDTEDGRWQGLAVHKSFNSYVAEVVEVSLADGAVRIEKVTCAVDCGVPVNPDVVRAQMEGGIGYGIGHAMRNQITLTDGAVDQLNFPDYEPLRISDIGAIEVHIVPSTEAPTGVGEPGTPPSAPALANAIAAATGTRITELPMNASVDFA